MHICSFIYIFIYACAYTSLKNNHAWTIHLQNMNPSSNAHTGWNKKHSCMHVWRYTSIHTFDFACMRSMLYDVDMWQCASLCITYTHRKTRTHVQSKCMLMHTLRLPVHGQMRAQILLYTYIYVLQSWYTNWFTNSCISVYANISSRAEHAQWFTIAEVRLQPTSHFEKPICKNVPKIGNKFGNYLE